MTIQLLDSQWIHRFYTRMRKKVILDKQIKQCELCKGLNSAGTENCPGYGNVNSPIFFIGQSLCSQCIETQIPFTEKSGDILDDIFLSIGKHKYDYFTSNLLHCHPPGNRPSKDNEIKNCLSFLFKEIKLVKPKLVIILGKQTMWDLSQTGKINFPSTSMKIIDCPKLSFSKYLTKITWVYHPAYFYRKGQGNDFNVWKEFITNSILKYDSSIPIHF